MKPPRPFAVPIVPIVREGRPEQQAILHSIDVLRFGSREARREMRRKLQRDATKGNRQAKALLAFADANGLR